MQMDLDISEAGTMHESWLLVKLLQEKKIHTKQCNNECGHPISKEQAFMDFV